PGRLCGVPLHGRARLDPRSRQLDLVVAALLRRRGPALEVDLRCGALEVGAGDPALRARGGAGRGPRRCWLPRDPAARAVAPRESAPPCVDLVVRPAAGVAARDRPLLEETR